MSDKGTPEGSKVLFGTPTTSRQVGFQFTNPEFASALGFENQITTYSRAATAARGPMGACSPFVAGGCSRSVAL